MTAESSEDMEAQQSLTFPVLSDRGNNVARSYGLVFTLPESVRPFYKSSGIDLPAANGDESFELPVPATYVIDQQGRIRWAHVDLDYTVRAEPADILKALDGIR
jgi:peroxiredoxin